MLPLTLLLPCAFRVCPPTSVAKVASPAMDICFFQRNKVSFYFMLLTCACLCLCFLISSLRPRPTPPPPPKLLPSV